MELATKTDSTKRQYLDHFNRFCKRWDLTPDEVYNLYAEAETPRDKRKFENMVKVHMNEMRKRGLSASTCRMASKAVHSFFEAQGVDFSLKAKDQPRGQYNGQRKIKTEQIRKLWDFAAFEFKLRDRALMAFLKDSGLRISDIAQLHCEDYWEAITVHNEVGEPFKVFEPFETKKTRAYAYIHIGPEAIEALDRYLENRGVLKPSDPLFVMRDGKRFNTGALSNVFFRLTSRLGKEGNRLSAHSLRKFHTTALEAEMNPHWIAKLQGKSVGNSMGPYSQPEVEPDKLTKAYMAAYDELRVFGPSEEEARRDAEIVKLTKRLEEQEELIRALGQT